MITGKKEELDDIAKRQQCPEHSDKVLTVAWHEVAQACPIGQDFHGTTITEEIVKAGGLYVLRCGAGHFPLEVTPMATLTEELKRGTLRDGPLKDNVQRGAERRAMAKASAVDAQPLGLMPVTDYGNGNRITIPELARAVDFAKRTDLDIRLGHVCLYHGRPYPTIDGYLYRARRSNRPFKMFSPPLGAKERKTYQVGELDYAWECNIYLVNTGEQFSGIGIITDAERTTMSKRDPSHFAAPVLQAKPWQMAQKRAEWQALRRAFPLGTEEQNGKDEGTDRLAAEKL